MIDAERMLGSLVRNAVGGGGRRRGRKRRKRRGGSSLLGTGGKVALGLGALGVAMAAVEHFTQPKSTDSQFDGGFRPPSPGGSSTPRPPLPVGGSEAPTPDLPPLPTVEATPAPPLPPEASPTAASTESNEEALLLVRAMIAAANADHELDEDERARILAALDATHLGDEEREFLLAELETPIDLCALVSGATTPELARQVYLASRMAIEVDTRAETNYLARLADRLGLDDAQVSELEDLLDGEDGETEA